MSVVKIYNDNVLMKKLKMQLIILDIILCSTLVFYVDCNKLSTFNVFLNAFHHPSLSLQKKKEKRKREFVLSILISITKTFSLQ